MNGTELTEEQRERIRKNREKALAIRRRKERELSEEKVAASATTAQIVTSSSSSSASSFDMSSERGRRNGEEVGVEDERGRSKRHKGSEGDGRAEGEGNGIVNSQKEKLGKVERQKEEEGGFVELEEFEIGAPPLVTKKEQAMKMYCLPEGTLAVCSYVEKDNPRKKGWSAMKLYHRTEIRRRARERHGGLDGLVAERRRREERRFRKDWESTRDIFQK